MENILLKWSCYFVIPHVTVNAVFQNSKYHIRSLEMENFIYPFSDSEGFLFSPSAAAPLHYTSSKGLWPSIQAWHRNPSHSLLRCHMTWLTALCKNRGSPGLLTTSLASLCTVLNSMISVFSVEIRTVHCGNASSFYTRWYPTWWCPSFCWQFWLLLLL